ncbi:helix-turn-helix domain-containing protein [Microbacterium sp. G2-8]|uniref:helix-turn-helix domain-containing protein n=1 Tax=Microbacterium sp. G2-8 TaxID=2842454 RepID=UPI001C8AC2B4|nr:helix-turn-helix transcriptional regulator [Microbacterium sp. G2-8]
MADLLPLPSRTDEPDPLWRHLVGERLRRMRHGRDETLAEVARRAGVSVQYLSEVERGLKEPSSEIVAAVLGALGGTLLDLTSGIADDLRTAAAPAYGGVALALAA